MSFDAQSENERQPANLKKLVLENKKRFSSFLGEFIYFRTYSRWIDSKYRREVWSETVTRYIDFMRENLGSRLEPNDAARLEKSILHFEVLPSMRLLFSAGKAARSNNIAAYNCAYLAIRDFNDLAELMYLLMCGTGVGFSVERRHIENLPNIKSQGTRLNHYQIEDCREGWCDALKMGLNSWSEGTDVEFDYSRIRPAGSRLFTLGGRSAGPEPLRETLEYIKKKIFSRQGFALSTLDVQDIACKIAECIVSGGVRRSALLSLSDLSDSQIRDSKQGVFFRSHPERSMVNLSVAYNEKPTCEEFLEEWIALLKGGSGERGIFNRSNLKSQLPKRRWLGFKKNDVRNCGTNPCGEIILKSKQFCNLSEVVARKTDSLETLLTKVELAAILGTYQASLVNFPYLNRDWKNNCVEERLLGVSITGIWDCPILRDPKNLKKLKEKACSTNRIYSKKFGIRRAPAVTCVKPSGTVSLLVNSSSGMHPHFAKYYIRRVRISPSDPLFQLMKNQGYPFQPELAQNSENPTTYVLDFPIKAPAGATTASMVSAIDQLEHWKKFKTFYTEHNPSITVSIRKEEWIKVVHWIYENWKLLGGLSFFPFERSSYLLAPYEEISKKQYEKMIRELPKIDFSKLFDLEKDDPSGATLNLECSSSVCDR